MGCQSGKCMIKTMSKSRIPLFERLQIESQSNCNRSCWFCPRTYDRSGKYLDKAGRSVLHRMPTEKILDLLDQAQALGFRGRVAFYHYSEPLLDERSPMLAREARKRGMEPYLHTKGDVLRSDDQLCNEVKKLYGLIVVGLYDYRTNEEELEENKRYWQKRLSGANLSFSPIGLSGARPYVRPCTLPARLSGCSSSMMVRYVIAARIPMGPSSSAMCINIRWRSYGSPNIMSKPWKISSPASGRDITCAGTARCLRQAPHRRAKRSPSPPDATMS